MKIYADYWLRLSSSVCPAALKQMLSVNAVLLLHFFPHQKLNAQFKLTKILLKNIITES